MGDTKMRIISHNKTITSITALLLVLSNTTKADVVIKNIIDPSFGSLTPFVNINLGDKRIINNDLCVYISDNSTVSLSISSANTDGQSLFLSGTNNQKIPYHVDLFYLQNQTTTSNYNLVTSDAKNGMDYAGITYDSSDYIDDNCQSQNLGGYKGNVRIAYHLLGDDVVSSAPDTYSDIVTLKVKVAINLMSP
jgi:hypothetical protein